ncbi:ABC transporter ATP-binding protein [Leucobacter sp. CSA2]|uniref:ABC transporter ATP-binding protein n=1 Tax=Leucobacter edaphi TaxID=2796472 RepID=A0A934UWJ0_9MICO|nr:ABC transporter ATP-binding protein [Leucobacter edaphi]MBK0421729.1 ABC transporter ATP-binding protein [Leucobacter edaphi]
MGELTAREIGFRIGDAELLTGVDVTAADGRVIGLLGPNGSGKSTLLRVLAGLRRPASGEVRLDGHPIAAMARRAVARRLAVVEQDTTANGDLTVRQVVELGRTPFRGRFDGLGAEDAAAVDEALARVNIASKQDRVWHTLSGGERQRAQLARALAQQPTEILLDEPTNHLDIRHQLELLELLRTLGVTCVIALHDLNLAARYCDRLLLLDGGRVVTSGTPAEVLTPARIREVYRVEASIATGDGRCPRIEFLGPCTE